MNACLNANVMVLRGRRCAVQENAAASLWLEKSDLVALLTWTDGGEAGSVVMTVVDQGDSRYFK